MLVHIVTASVNQLVNLRDLEDASAQQTKVLVIDEGDKSIRKDNDKILSSLPHEYYGPEEREQWFNERLGRGFKKYQDLIPKNCHAETAFGFLKAYEDQATVILEIDDDVGISGGFVKEHISNLFCDGGITVSSQGKWYNTVENLYLNVDERIFPRGHPYGPPCRYEDYVWSKEGGSCVLNMGLWNGHPDLDALTILYNGGLDGRCNLEGKGCRKEKIVLGKGTYFAICSMNTSFLCKIIPAFYQLYMNFMGVDRFDDIWSGVFLKRIADHIGDKICLGKPLGLHLKRARDIFKDLRKEMDGLDMNEHLWKMSEEADLSAKTYADCYAELADHLGNSVEKWFKNVTHIKFWKVQTEKMRRWVELVDKIS